MNSDKQVVIFLDSKTDGCWTAESSTCQSSAWAAFRLYHWSFVQIPTSFSLSELCVQPTVIMPSDYVRLQRPWENPSNVSMQTQAACLDARGCLAHAPKQPPWSTTHDFLQTTIRCELFATICCGITARSRVFCNSCWLVTLKHPMFGAEPEFCMTRVVSHEVRPVVTRFKAHMKMIYLPQVPQNGHQRWIKLLVLWSDFIFNNRSSCFNSYWRVERTVLFRTGPLDQYI